MVFKFIYKSFTKYGEILVVAQNDIEYMVYVGLELEKLGFILIVIGIIMVFIAAIAPLFTIITTNIANVEISGAGCIVLFFIPICFGYGEFALQLIIIAIILAIVLAVTYFIIYRMAVGILKSEKATYI